MSRARFIALSIVVDAVLVNAAFVLAFLIRFGGRLPSFNFEAYLILMPVLTVLFIGGAWVYGLYDPERSDTAWAVARGAVAAVTFGTLLTAAIAFFGSTRTAPFARSTFLIAWALGIVLLVGWRIALLRLAAVGWPEQRVLIIGTDRGSVELAEKVSQRSRWGWTVAGLLDEVTHPRHPPPSSVGGFPVLGTVDDVAQIVGENRVTRVIIASPIALREFVESLMLGEELKVRVDVVPDLYEIFIGSVDAIVDDVPLMEISRTTVPRYYAAAKLVTDAVISFVGLVITSPLLLFAVMAIVLDDGLPVFFSQERVGRGLKPFRIHKLRTMIKNAEEDTGPVLADEDDPRITRVGRALRAFRIDEFPQFINILKGEMSFVGPRPERPHFVEQYVATVPGYRERFNMKPGVTGLAQVSGSYATTPERKLKYDLIYMYHQTPAMDLQIITETLRVVLTGRGSR
ncbi:MAG: sugar transferase [Thermoleophilia bacterium]|nr:sugar transferase [Thermoleophilia bacterium]